MRARHVSRSINVENSILAGMFQAFMRIESGSAR